MIPSLVISSFLFALSKQHRNHIRKNLDWPVTMRINGDPEDTQCLQGLIYLKWANFFFSEKETHFHFCLSRLGNILVIHKYECSPVVHLKYSRVSICWLFSCPPEQSIRVHSSHWVAMKTEVLLFVGQVTHTSRVCSSPLYPTSLHQQYSEWVLSRHVSACVSSGELGWYRCLFQTLGKKKGSVTICKLW